MKKNQNVLVRQFWSHVFTTPDRTGVLAKNEAPGGNEAVIVGGMGMFPSAVVIERPAYIPVTWKECGYKVSEIMLFLKKKGVKKGDRVAILAWNSPEYVWTDLAIQSLGAVTVPVYPNSAAEQVNYILHDCGARLLLGDGKDQTGKVARDSGVETALFSEATAGGYDYSHARGEEVRIAHYDTRMEMARVEKDFHRPADAHGRFLGIDEKDISTFIYTSGSTGAPKGVVLTHFNIARCCQSLLKRFDFNHTDRYLSYLPLAHVYERVNGTSLCLYAGVPAAYCKVDEMAEVVKLVKPTVLLGVPAVWRKIKDKAEAQLNGATGLKKLIVGWSLKQSQPGFKRCIADMLVFSKVRAALGGDVRVMLSGGAPIAGDVLKFFELCGFKLIQGYGLTETCGGIAVNTLTENRVGSVGRLIDCVQIKIVPEPGDNSGSGVIWLKGDCITGGYWNLPEANAKSFKDDWFDTGDLGRIDADGYLWITGRKKRMLKTDGGKYVAPEKLENAFDGIDELVQYVVPVGDGKPFIGALIFVNQDKAKAFLAGKGVTVQAGANAAEFYAKHAEVVKRVAEIVEIANKTLERWETIKQFSIVPLGATTDNVLTNKLSIKTEEVLKRYGTMVEELYTRPHPKS